jgi:hypothetical protein
MNQSHISEIWESQNKQQDKYLERNRSIIRQFSTCHMVKEFWIIQGYEFHNALIYKTSPLKGVQSST